MVLQVNAIQNVIIHHRPQRGILKWLLSGSVSVSASVCPQLYPDNRWIDLLENLHSDSVYIWRLMQVS